MVTAPRSPTALLGLGTALPPHRLGPEQARDMLVDLFPRLRRVTLPPVTRYTVLPIDTRGRTLGDTIAAYRTYAPPLALEAARRAIGAAGIQPADIDTVITTSCTGYLVPALDVDLIQELGLREDVRRIPITELGCSAGLAALGIAHEHLQREGAGPALVVAVELPSINLQPEDRSIDNLTATIVFGDGAGAAVVARGEARDRLALRSMGTRLVPRSRAYLGFDLRDSGFHTVLDPGLARLLQTSLPGVLEGFWPGARPAFWAVHAGGLRIFDAVESALGLPSRALQPSREVFLQMGNLSSASILFVLQEIARSEAAGEGIAVAFGPGVSVELARLSRSS
ncbi:MAG: type III polyketide synthase [Candidatus Dormibacteraeota bacterium]|nr:type III polyketide synthase [Candidatus Dormibacteraeota bacterium]